MRIVVSGDDLGGVEAAAVGVPDEQMAVSADGHRRAHDGGYWMLCDGTDEVALKVDGLCRRPQPWANLNFVVEASISNGD